MRGLRPEGGSVVADRWAALRGVFAQRDIRRIEIAWGFSTASAVAATVGLYLVVFLTLWAGGFISPGRIGESGSLQVAGG